MLCPSHWPTRLDRHRRTRRLRPPYNPGDMALAKKIFQILRRVTASIDAGQQLPIFCAISRFSSIAIGNQTGYMGRGSSVKKWLLKSSEIGTMALFNFAEKKINAVSFFE
jgi:hypothetical protein